MSDLSAFKFFWFKTIKNHPEDVNQFLSPLRAWRGQTRSAFLGDPLIRLA
jgi:hypothetical protein